MVKRYNQDGLNNVPDTAAMAAAIADTQARLSAMENGPVKEFAAVKANAAAGAAAAPFARVKWAGSLQKTDSTGKWVQIIPAGLMQTGLSIIGPVVRGSGSYDATATVTGDVASGFTVTVQFQKRKQSIGVLIPAVVLGAVATTVNVNMTETVPGIVVFDIGFAEPDVIGP